MKRMLVSLALATSALGAGAQSLSLVSPDPAIFLGFNASGVGSFATGLFATINVSGPARVTYEFVGSESGYDTSLFANFLGGSGLVTESSGSSASGYVGAAGALDFGFRDNHGGLVHNTAGASMSLLSNPSFVVLGRRLPLSGATSYLLGFNDSYRGDADFDDLVVRVSVAPIPEPSTYALMLAGLGAVGFIARRRRPA